MNTPNDELDLRRRLRQLPRERTPQNDLWRGIEARLATGEGIASLPQRARRVWRPLLAAAAVALAALLIWRPSMQSLAPAPEIAQVPQTLSSPARSGESMLRREADGIALEYRLAIATFADAPLPLELQAATAELDASAQRLHQALREQPEATYLLDRLRRTYEQRLKLTQRGVLG
jgi:hypothetical protein